MRYPYYPVHTDDNRRSARRLRRWLAKRGIQARVEKRWTVTVHPDEYEYALEALEEPGQESAQ